MSKYMDSGDGILTLGNVKQTARLGLEDSEGEISVGRPANLAVIRLLNEPVVFGDYTGVIKTGHQFLKNMMTIKNGILVYRDQEI